MTRFNRSLLRAMAVGAVITLAILLAWAFAEDRPEPHAQVIPASACPPPPPNPCAVTNCNRRDISKERIA